MSWVEARAMTKSAEDVLEAARVSIRVAIADALRAIKAESGLCPTDVDIDVDMVSTGPQFGRKVEYLLGDVRVRFRV